MPVNGPVASSVIVIVVFVSGAEPAVSGVVWRLWIRGSLPIGGTPTKDRFVRKLCVYVDLMREVVFVLEDRWSVPLGCMHTHGWFCYKLTFVLA